MDFKRYNQALETAARAHGGQFRKSSPIPYITHPVAVAGLVAQYGGNEDQQIAALLHDVLEDAGAEWAAAIEADFGPKVLALVQACTDGTPDASGRKAPWKERKAAYLEGLRAEDAETQLVSACDKLANLVSIDADLRIQGVGVFERFKAGREGTLWYYGELLGIFSANACPVHGELLRAYQSIQAELTRLGERRGENQRLRIPNGRIGRQIGFLAELEKLKLVSRQNAVLDQSRQENSAEHSWHVAVMALILAEAQPAPDLDLLRVMKMLLVHDVVEIDAGDNFVFDAATIQSIKRKEFLAASRLFGILPADQGSELLALWQEFEDRVTPEARYAAAMDAIQPLLNHLLTASDHANPLDLKASTLLSWKSHIRETSAELWDLSQELVRQSVDRGLYRED